MKFNLGQSISIDQIREASADDVLAALQQIANHWSEAVLDRTQAVSISELVALPEGRIFIVYRDRASMFERRRFDGKPDPSAWIRIEWHDDRLTFVADAWSSPSGRIVRKIVGIDR